MVSHYNSVLDITPDVRIRKEEFGGVVFNCENASYYPLNNLGFKLMQIMMSGGTISDLSKKIQEEFSIQDREIHPFQADEIRNQFLNQLYETGNVFTEFPTNFLKDVKAGSNFVEKHSAKQALYKDLKLSAPLFVSLSVIFTCNLFCEHCYVSSTTEMKPDNMTPSQIKHLLNRLYEQGVFTINFTGGEPLIFDGIYDILEYAKELGFFVSLNTNGTALTDKNTEALKRIGVDKVRISVDSPDSRVHDTFRGKKGAWQKTVAGIKRLAELGINVQINTTISVLSINSRLDIDKIIALAKSLSVRKLHFGKVYSTGRANDEQKIEQKQVSELLEYVVLLRDQGESIIGKVTHFQSPTIEGFPHYDGCGNCTGDFYAYIGYNGKVYPCTNLYKEEWCMGDAFDQNLSEILTSSAKAIELKNLIWDSKGEEIAEGFHG